MEAELMPMLCKSGSIPAIDHDPARWVMEPKVDGWRAITHVKDGVAHTYARSGANYDGKCPHIDAALLMVLPDDTVLDGEFSGAGGWGDVQGVMTRHANNGTLLTYVIFDVIRVAGMDARSMPWDSRRELLEKIGASVVFDGTTLIINPYGEPDQDTADAMVAAGAEGVVLKRRDSRYANSRSALWLKYKPKIGTDEGEIIGFKPGEKGGKFDGMVGAFRVRMLGSGAETTVKCGVDATHQEATDHPERWLGTVIEISHHGIGKTGKPRHPQFHRRRDDMAPEPATKEKKQVSTNARARQVARMVKATDRSTQVERFETGRSLTTGKPRNYNAMGGPKLLRCIRELEAGAGDAYNRAMNSSGNPEADLELARTAARSKGLL